MGLDLRNNTEASERPAAGLLSGCLYSAFVVSASGAMMLVNAFLCLTIYAALPKHSSQEVASRVGQLFFFIGPILLLIVEWNLLDRVQRLFQRQN